MPGRHLTISLVAALVLGLLAGVGTASAKTSSRTSAAGAVPPAIANPVGPDIPVPFVQEFKFTGKKFKRTKVKSLEVTVNTFGNGPGANGDLSAVLVDPRGDANTIVDPKGGSTALPLPRIGNAMLGLTFKDASFAVPCSPFEEPRFNCNYLQGASPGAGVGVMSGELNAVLNSFFADKGTRGTWKLVWRDGNTDDVTTTLGPSTLRINSTKGKKK